MITHYMVLDCVWDNEEDKKIIELAYDICILNVTKLFRKDCIKRHARQDYCGPAVYMFVGDEENLIEFIKKCYMPNGDKCSEEDMDDLREEIRNIKELEL